MNKKLYLSMLAAVAAAVVVCVAAIGQPNPGQQIVTTLTGTELINVQPATGPQFVAISATNLATFVNTGGTGGGAFTTLSASGAVTGAGFTARFATPGPIGNTVASTGAFTTLTASGQITSTTGTPTIASGACGTTTNGAVVSGSTNQSGSITIGSATTTTCTLSWSATLAVAPNACVFFPMNATAAATGTTVARVGAPSTTSVVLTGSALASSNYAYVCL